MVVDLPVCEDGKYWAVYHLSSYLSDLPYVSNVRETELGPVFNKMSDGGDNVENNRFSVPKPCAHADTSSIHNGLSETATLHTTREI